MPLANEVSRFFSNHGIFVLDWPPFSPDMNCIENVWGKLKEKVCKHSILNREKLISMVNNVWNNNDKFNDFCKQVVSSMPRRVAKLKQEKGGYKGY